MMDSQSAEAQVGKSINNAKNYEWKFFTAFFLNLEKTLQ